MSNIKLIIGDITEYKGDAIVNAANNTLLGGGGVDGAIHNKGGKIILEQCKKIGGCATGEAVITTAGNLFAKYVIHTVGPVYGRDLKNQGRLLYNAYYNSLELAKEYGLTSIAFPSISTGVYGYPVEEAAKVVAKAIDDFNTDSEEYFEEILIVAFDEKTYDKYYEIF